ncbi:MAG: hypothetical protein IZT56_04195 [Bacteroidetes bacterium]|nr:hypothetical protein [Bacteroidota bacterium]
MKKLMLMALALVIGTTTLFASNVIPDDSPNKMRSQIVALMDAPDFNVNREITVTITFTFSSASEIIVLNVDSKNTDVLNYVRKNLNQKVISNPGEKFKHYTMPLTLKEG